MTEEEALHVLHTWVPWTPDERGKAWVLETSGLIHLYDNDLSVRTGWDKEHWLLLPAHDQNHIDTLITLLTSSRPPNGCRLKPEICGGLPHLHGDHLITMLTWQKAGNDLVEQFRKHHANLLAAYAS